MLISYHKKNIFATLLTGVENLKFCVTIEVVILWIILLFKDY